MRGSAETPASEISVLYVQTSDALREQVRATLDGVNVESCAVDCRGTAVEAAATDGIDCVVITDSFPETDVVALVESVREQRESLPILLLASDGSEELAMRTTRAGVTEYVPTGTNRSDDERLAGRIRALAERERKRRGAQRERERLERNCEHIESLVESAPLAIVELDSEAKVRRWNRGAEETFGWSKADVMGELNPVIPEDNWGAFEDRMERFLAGEEIRGVEITGQTKAGEEVQLLLSAAPIPTTEGAPQRITAVLNDITDQKRIEYRLRQLQQTAQQLSVAPSMEAIGEIATDAATDVLGLDQTGLWRYDDVENALVPLSVTSLGQEVVPELPQFGPGDSLAWEVFEAGEVRAYDDLTEVEARYNPESTIRSEILVPLGEFGVLLTGSTSTRQFSEADVDLFRILGATVEAALVRAKREEELRLQNDRLDEFADVVAHDLRNPLSVAEGFLDLAEESGDPEQFAKVESALDRIGQLIDDLLTLAQGEATVETTERIDLAGAADQAWELVETTGATLTVRDPPTVSGDPSRLRQLFENLFRNAVEHGSTSSRSEPDNTVEDGSTDSQTQSADSVEDRGSDAGAVTVTVGSLPDEEGFYVEDDGAGIRQDRRALVLDHGVTFSETGTGFGLSIVADIARAHGWAVTVTEGDASGARLEFRLSA